MASDISLLPLHGQFIEIYRQLQQNKKLFNRTPIVFCEGDSWFSTPLAMNILDWLVFPTPEDDQKGVPLLGRGGLFFRDEQSGSLATEMFTKKNVRRLMKFYRAFDFDIALLSGGGNDFVGAFLEQTFAGPSPMPQSVDEAFARIDRTKRFEEVRKAWELMLGAMVAERPKTPIVTHTYCYPLKMGLPGKLTLGNIGAVVLLKKDVGPWIGPHLQAFLSVDDQRAFVRRLIDAFAERVLFPLREDKRFKGTFRVLDTRDACPAESDWFDEMHPTGASFHRLSKLFAAEIHDLFELP